MSYCKVAYCRFKTTHVTKGHKCGRCIDQFGHGEIECSQPWLKAHLQEYLLDIMPINLQCTVSDCQNKELHSIDAHHCPVCLKREAHTVSGCPRNHINIGNVTVSNANVVKNVKCPICRSDNPTVSTKKIPGLSDKCCICIDNNVEILLPTCYHCCMCLACLEKFA